MARPRLARYYGDDTKKFLKGSVHTNEAISIRLSQNPKKKVSGLCC